LLRCPHAYSFVPRAFLSRMCAPDERCCCVIGFVSHFDSFADSTLGCRRNPLLLPPFVLLPAHRATLLLWPSELGQGFSLKPPHELCLVRIYILATLHNKDLAFSRVLNSFFRGSFLSCIFAEDDESILSTFAQTLEVNIPAKESAPG